jgi:hypothetical protein
LESRKKKQWQVKQKRRGLLAPGSRKEAYSGKGGRKDHEALG